MMAWNYDPAKLEVGLNRIRFNVGDTDTNDQQISDEEINAILAMEANLLEASAIAAEGIAAKYNRYGAAEEAQRYFALADHLRRNKGVDYL